MPLKNPRHEAFAQGLVKGLTADEAYASAGYRPHRGNASTLRANQSILDRVAELQSKSAARAVLTVDDIARQLDEDRAFARHNGASSAAVAATMGKAKVLGLIVDKAELSGPNGGPIPTLDASKLSTKALAEIMAARNGDPDAE